MSDEPDESLYSAEIAAVELAAAELIARTKKIPTDKLELPIVDQSCVWAVTVKRMGIREPDEPK